MNEKEILKENAIQLDIMLYDTVSGANKKCLMY